MLDYFDEEDVLIFNNTKVFTARMYGRKEKTGAQIEVFLLRELNSEQKLWDVLVDPARKIRIGNKLYFGEDESLVAEVIAAEESREAAVNDGMRRMFEMFDFLPSTEKSVIKSSLSLLKSSLF